MAEVERNTESDSAASEAVAGPSTSGSLSTDEEQRQRGRGEHGCEHYRRRCRVVAPCCNEAFWCRHCHNEAKADLPNPEERHELDRTAVREVECALCNARQPIATECYACGVAFGEYACLRCSFYDDDVSKMQFHCDKCGICRVGGHENYFHCDKCGACYHNQLQDNHVCVENSMRHNCPVCFEYLFDSIRQTSVLPCGHTIHTDCYEDMQRNNRWSCPICLKSVTDLGQLWRSIDEDIAAAPMPEEYAEWRADICCNDCNSASNVPFHLLGMKCPGCGSYNTRRLALQRPPAPPDPVVGGIPGGGGNDDDAEQRISPRR